MVIRATAIERRLRLLPWHEPPRMLRGAGIRGGHVHGKSDRIAAYPAEDPVSPADLAATVYHALGIKPDMSMSDREGRVASLTEGSPVLSVFA